MHAKINVGCLSLTSEMNDGNIRLRMTLKINVGCLSLASEMNDGNIRPHLMLFSSHYHLEILVARSGHQNVAFFKSLVAPGHRATVSVEPCQ